ncbi:EthD family reductase [Arenibacter certesii]|uniref:Ethyl tert-butyl ether degradation protein EthD n=1 Tax=Arenibacter certesii TaxID=228955 RepID=A0A918MHT3_9FLAO|nr:EthD family reductase [Arenibacter certesii]GGW22459.1 ethyl tert-butyl ether degradation protein EthD [Arenibacter certesii]
MIKLTVLYGHPTNAAEFEAYYANTHLSKVAKMKGLAKMELTKFLNYFDGSKPDYYRMAEFWFNTPEAMQKTMSSSVGQDVAADLPNFVTGGVTLLVGEVEEL